MFETLTRIPLDAVGHLPPVVAALVLAVVLFLEPLPGIGLMVPSDVTTLLAGTRISDASTYIGLVAVAVVGQVSGESATWALGRRYGAGLRDGRIGRWIGRSRWDRATTLVERHGPVAVFVAHIVPFARAAVPLVAGVTGMPYRRVIGPAIAGSTAWAVCYLGLGAAGAHVYERYGPLVTVFLAVPALLTVAVCAALRRRTARPAGRLRLGSPSEVVVRRPVVRPCAL